MRRGSRVGYGRLTMTRTFLALATAALSLALPAVAGAGTVTRSGSTLTYQAAAATGANESVGLSVDGGRTVIRSDRGFTGALPAGCNDNDTVIDCTLASVFVVNLLGFSDDVSLDGATGAMTIEAHGGAGGDELDGTVNGDRLFGDEDDDNLTGDAGNDLLDGGAGSDGLNDGTGDDTVMGGPADDRLHAGTGRDGYVGGEGSDQIYYDARTGAVTVTLDGQADDGEAGEGDNVTEVEDVASGSGPDRIVGNELGNRLSAGDGNDSVTGGAGEDYLDGGPGDDTIDARDGGYDTVECGPGNDTAIVDQNDLPASGCETLQVPDADGDGYIADDCDNTDPTRHPGALEIIADGIDQDCDNRDAPLPRIVHPINAAYTPFKRRKGVRVDLLRIREMKQGDRVRIKCKGKGCAFKTKTRVGRKGKSKLQLEKLFKRRILKRGATIEIRITRPGYVGKVATLKVTKKLKMPITSKCLLPGKSKPSRCP